MNSNLFQELLALVDITSIADILQSKTGADIPVGEPHENLFTSKQLYKGKDSRITSFVYQRIQGNGKIAEHNHVDEHEMIFFSGNVGYANLSNDDDFIKKLNGLTIIFVPAGVHHGNSNQVSTGDWVSIKVRAN